MEYLVSLALLISHCAASHINTVGTPIILSPEYFHPIESLYHSQDRSGHYVYGYATPTSTKSEIKTADGVTHGGYSYIDADGHLQTVQYTADALNGFRVAASNLPQDLPDVAHARAAHLSTVEAVKADIAALRAVPYSNPVAVAHSDVPQLPLHQQLPEPVTDLPEVAKARAAHLATLQAAYASHASAAVLPQPVQDLPEVVRARAEHLAAFESTRAQHEALRAQISLSPIPNELNGHVVPIHTTDARAPLPVAPTAQVAYAPEQYSYGPYSYGYAGPHSTKSETQSADGVVRGGYSYIDAFGVLQNINYVADSHGFRVAASNLPVDRNHLALQHGVSPTHEPIQERKVIVPATYQQEIVY